MAVVEDLVEGGLLRERLVLRGTVLRHTWLSRHLAAGTPIKWIQDRGGWTTAKILLDVYGHFMPSEIRASPTSSRALNRRPETHPRRTLALRARGTSCARSAPSP